MKTSVLTPKSWATSSLGAAVDTSSLDMVALGDHLGQCNTARGHWFALHCAAQTMHGFIASRLVTSLFAAALLIGYCQPGVVGHGGERVMPPTTGCQPDLVRVAGRLARPNFGTHPAPKFLVCNAFASMRAAWAKPTVPSPCLCGPQPSFPI
jgi:hypothetical protein